MAWKAIIPTDIDTKAINGQLLKGLVSVGKSIEKDFEKTVSTWNTKPTFKAVVVSKRGNFSILVSTDNEIYGYVDQGTKPHIIRGNPLAFSSKSKPKTRPGIIGSGQGSSGGNDVFATEVHHPGTKAREFSLTIQKDWNDGKYQDWMQKSMGEAAKASGHFI